MDVGRFAQHRYLLHAGVAFGSGHKAIILLSQLVESFKRYSNQNETYGFLPDRCPKKHVFQIAQSIDEPGMGQGLLFWFLFLNHTTSIAVYLSKS